MSIPEIADASGVSKETAKRMLKWMEQEGMVEVTQGGGRTTNTYRIIYRSGVTHDPAGGSPMTPLNLKTKTRGVTHDPSKLPKNDHLPAKTQNTIEHIIEVVHEELLENVSDEKETTPVILGSDPDHRSTETVQRTTQPKANPSVKSLSWYFLNNRNIVMHKKTSKDVQILQRTMKLLLSAGLTPPVIRSMIDQFFSDTRFRSYDNPVLAFSSKKIQKVLMDRITVDVQIDDPVLALMSQDFVRGDLELPWDESADNSIRMAVTSRCLETLYRYPELVSNIIQQWPGDFRNHDFLDALSSVESLVKHGLGRETANVSEILDRLSFMPLPKDLIKGTVRDAADTMVSAIYEYRRTNRV